MRERCLALSALCAFTAASAGAPTHWVSAWSAAPADPGPFSYALLAPGALRGKTVRNVVHVSVDGQALRLRLSNALSAEPLTLDEVDLAMQRSGASLVRGSSRPVTFGGSRRVTIPAGALALSDPIAMAVTHDQMLAISIFSSTAGTLTVHPASFQDTFLSTPGNFASREDAAGFSATARAWYFLSGIDVLAAESVKGTLVAFGDSITDGDGSTPNGNQRWPDLLGRRMAADAGGPMLAIANTGIGGNRVLGNSPCFGIGALARLDRDVLSQTGALAVIYLEGINDILQPDFAAGRKNDRIAPCLPTTQATVDELIAGDRQIAAQVRARGLKIYAGTLLPYLGFAGWTAAGEAKRQALNQWIKTGGAFDGVIDFAAATADVRNPALLARDKDSGDHLHPNAAGYAAMARAVDLAMLRRGLP